MRRNGSFPVVAAEAVAGFESDPSGQKSGGLDLYANKQTQFRSVGKLPSPRLVPSDSQWVAGQSPNLRWSHPWITAVLFKHRDEATHPL